MTLENKYLYGYKTTRVDITKYLHPRPSLRCQLHYLCLNIRSSKGMRFRMLYPQVFKKNEQMKHHSWIDPQANLIVDELIYVLELYNPMVWGCHIIMQGFDPVDFWSLSEKVRRSTANSPGVFPLSRLG